MTLKTRYFIKHLADMAIKLVACLSVMALSMLFILTAWIVFIHS